MKTLKLKKGPIIAVSVVCAILLIVGIVFALLPEETYVSWGDNDSASSRYVALIVCGILDFLMLVIVVTTTITQKNSFKKINEIMQSIGEDAIALDGSIVDREAARENATKTVLSVLGGILSALFLGIGFYKIYGNDNGRYFILYSEGLYIFNKRGNKEIQLNKTEVKNIKITKKRNSLVVELTPSYITFSVKTKGLDISEEELTAKFEHVFANQIPNPYQNV